MYYGHWLYGKKHGKGRLLKTNGEKYSGDFENDKMNEGNLNDENASRSFAGTHASES